jgi:hypothetical protein
MGLFDMFKDKASELLQGAGDKVSEVTGLDLPLGGVADQVTESAAGLGETARGLADAASDQVGGATGVDLPVDAVADQVAQETDSHGESTGQESEQ